MPIHWQGNAMNTGVWLLIRECGRCEVLTDTTLKGMEKRKLWKMQKCASWYPSRTFFSGSVILSWWIAGKNNSQTSSKISFRTFILVVLWSCCVVMVCEQGFFKCMPDLVPLAVIFVVINAFHLWKSNPVLPWLEHPRTDVTELTDTLACSLLHLFICIWGQSHSKGRHFPSFYFFCFVYLWIHLKASLFFFVLPL